MYYIYTKDFTEFDGFDTYLNTDVYCKISDCHLKDGVISNKVLREIYKCHVTHLVFNDCNIVCVNNIKNIQYIECINCPQLESIYPISTLFELYCIDCPKLKWLPNTSSVILLSIENCNIKEIPDYYKLEELYIKESIIFNGLDSLVKLQCSDCKDLMIPDLPKLGKIICFNTSFSSIGKLPKLKNVQGSLYSISYIKNFNKIKAFYLLLLNCQKKRKNYASSITDINIWKKIHKFV